MASDTYSINGKCLRIYLCDLVHDYLPGNFSLPLNIGLLAAYLKQRFGAELNITLFKSPSKFLQTLKSGPPPQLIAFSNYSWNQELNRKIMVKAHTIAPDAVLCSGGPHIRTDDQGITDYLRQHREIDFYCMYEGEIPLGNLVEQFLSREKFFKKNACDSPIAGVAYLSNNELVYQPKDFQAGELENIPSPYLTGWLDDWLHTGEWMPVLETNRGCPYHCTFCVWGISTMDNVRKFSLDRVKEEIRYVAKKSPSPRWIVADANFGMLNRDIEIAEEIRYAADQFGKLRCALVLWAKNSSSRTQQIAQILGPLCEPKINVQSLDPEVLEIIKRDNIKIQSMADLLDDFHGRGLEAGTDILLGLPGQSYSSYLKTLRETFKMGFDFLDNCNIRMLPGSEMEIGEEREAHKIKTKFRLISGHYGKYDGDIILDYEESVRSSKDLSEHEMFFLRKLDFFIVLFWNMGFAKPLLQWLYLQSGQNPLDMILDQIKNAEGNTTLNKFLSDYELDDRNEWFETPEALEAYYSKNFDDLLRQGFFKLNLKYAARFLLDPSFAKVLLMDIARRENSPVAYELASFCFDRIFFPGASETFKKRKYSTESVKAMKEINPSILLGDQTCIFSMEESAKTSIEYELTRHNFAQDPLRALSLTLEGPFQRLFLYNFEFKVLSKANESLSNILSI